MQWKNYTLRDSVRDLCYLLERAGHLMITIARGDNKLAKYRLRGLAQHKTHHFSTFRTGLLLGLALPALVDGLYLSELHWWYARIFLC